MRKLYCILLAIIVILNTGCSQKKQVDLYVLNLKDNKIEKFYSAKGAIHNIKWSHDSKYIYLEKGDSEYLSYSLKDKNLKSILKHDFDTVNYTYKERIYSKGIKDAIKKKNASFPELILCDIYQNYNKAVFATNAGVCDIYLYDIDKKSSKYLGHGDLWGHATNDMLVYLVSKNGDPQDIYNTDDFDTYIYDMKENKSIKIANFLASCYFAPDGFHIVFMPDNANFNI